MNHQLNYKVGRDYLMNPLTQEKIVAATHDGAGIPFWEAKYSHDHVHGVGFLKLVYKKILPFSSPTIIGNTALTGGANAQARFRIK